MNYSEVYKGFKTWKKYQPKQYRKICNFKSIYINQDDMDFYLWALSKRAYISADFFKSSSSVREVIALVNEGSSMSFRIRFWMERTTYKLRAQ